MKNNIKLPYSALTILLMLVPLSMKAIVLDCGVCPPNTSCCETSGQCAYNCPSHMQPIGEAGKLYVLPEGTLLACEPKNTEILKLHIVLENVPSPIWACPSPGGIPGPLKKEPHFKAEPTVIYSFPEGAAFVCASTNEPPQKITVKNPAEGFPNVYWACPSAHSSPPSANNGDVSKK